MMIVKEKILTTEEEFESVNQQDRKSNLPDRLPKKRGRRAKYNSDTKSFEEFMESVQ